MTHFEVNAYHAWLGKWRWNWGYREVEVGAHSSFFALGLRSEIYVLVENLSDAFGS